MVIRVKLLEKIYILYQNNLYLQIINIKIFLTHSFLYEKGYLRINNRKSSCF